MNCPHCGRPDPDINHTAAQVSPIVNVIRMALCAGYPPVEHHIRSAVYQLSLAWGICCKYHAIGLAEWHGLTKIVRLKLIHEDYLSDGGCAGVRKLLVVPNLPGGTFDELRRLSSDRTTTSKSDCSLEVGLIGIHGLTTGSSGILDGPKRIGDLASGSRRLSSNGNLQQHLGVIMFVPPVVPSIPKLDTDATSNAKTTSRSLIIVERLVFAVYKRSREVFLPLPNYLESVNQIAFDLESHINMKRSNGGFPGQNKNATDGNDPSGDSNRSNHAPDSRPSQPNTNSVELLSVIVSFNPVECLLPGLIVFPGALMTYRL